MRKLKMQKLLHPEGISDEELKKIYEEEEKIKIYDPQDKIKLIHNLEKELLQAYEIIESFLSHSLDEGVSCEELKEKMNLHDHPKMYLCRISGQIYRLKEAKEKFDKAHGIHE